MRCQAPAWSVADRLSANRVAKTEPGDPLSDRPELQQGRADKPILAHFGPDEPVFPKERAAHKLTRKQRAYH